MPGWKDLWENDDFIVSHRYNQIKVLVRETRSEKFYPENSLEYKLLAVICEEASDNEKRLAQIEHIAGGFVD